MSEKKPPRPLTWRTIAIALGKEKPPPDPKTGAEREATRGVDILSWLGIKGGKWGLIAAALMHVASSNQKLATAMNKQTETLATTGAAAVKAGEAQVFESRETRLVMIGFKNEQEATTREIRELKEAIGVSKSGVPRARREARLVKPDYPAPATPTPLR